jgi:hypothetical protein
VTFSRFITTESGRSPQVSVLSAVAVTVAVAGAVALFSSFLSSISQDINNIIDTRIKISIFDIDFIKSNLSFVYFYSDSIAIPPPKFCQRFFFTRNAFLWEKKEKFLPKMGVICEKRLLQGTSKPFQATLRDFFSNKSGLLWEKIQASTCRRVKFLHSSPRRATTFRTRQKTTFSNN